MPKELVSLSKRSKITTEDDEGKVTFIRKEEKISKDLTLDEVMAMFKKAKKNPRDYRMLNFLFYFAPRNTEMRNLQKMDIDLVKKTVKFKINEETGSHPKNSKERIIPIIEIVPFPEDYGEDSIFVKLEKWMKESKTKYIFDGNSALGNISDRTVRRIVKKYARLAKIKEWEKVHPHTLRASYATFLDSMFVSIPSIGKVLGHTGKRADETTRIYAHHTTSTSRREIELKVNIARLSKTIPVKLSEIRLEKDSDRRLEKLIELSIEIGMANLGIAQ